MSTATSFQKNAKNAFRESQQYLDPVDKEWKFRDTCYNAYYACFHLLCDILAPNITNQWNSWDADRIINSSLRRPGDHEILENIILYNSYKKEPVSFLYRHSDPRVIQAQTYLNTLKTLRKKSSYGKKEDGVKVTKDDAEHSLDLMDQIFNAK